MPGVPDAEGLNGDRAAVDDDDRTSHSTIFADSEVARSLPDVFIPTNQNQPEHGRNDTFQLNIISMAAEQEHLQELEPYDDFDQQGLHAPGDETAVLPEQPTDLLPTFDSSLFVMFDDNLNTWNDNPLFSHHIIPPQMSTTQPFPLFEPDYIVSDPSEELTHKADEGQEASLNTQPSTQSQSRFTRPHIRCTEAKLFSEPTTEDMGILKEHLALYEDIVPRKFQIPSRLALSRYLSAFISGYHEHMPFIHIPSLSLQGSTIELILAIAATGAFYRFEQEEGMLLFLGSEAIIMERLRLLESRNVQDRTHGGLSSQTTASVVNGETTVHAEADSADFASTSNNQNAENMQTLLLLMAISTWAKQASVSRKGLHFQALLASMVRRHGLTQVSTQQYAPWKEWARNESMNRTKLIVFCFLNLQSLLHDSPSPMRPSEINLPLPCTARMFEAKTAEDFAMAQQQSTCTEHTFQASFMHLFDEPGRGQMLSHSSLGNYVLIHALLQNIFYAQEMAKPFGLSDTAEMSPYIQKLERALRNWQRGWQQNSASSTDLVGPVAFNCVALLRIAYIRLSLQSGPCRALETRDPKQIARAFLNSPSPLSSPQLLRALTHSAYALSIPVKIGLKFVAQTQSVFWSIQHSLCSLECAVLLSSWLNALANQELLISSLGKKEQHIIKLVESLLEETNCGRSLMRHDGATDQTKINRLGAGVVKVWAEIFRGPQTWPIVDTIGSSLELYAQLLEAV